MAESEQFKQVPENEHDTTTSNGSDIVRSADPNGSANTTTLEDVAGGEPPVAAETAITPVRPSHATFLRTMFIGPSGIRAGWRLLIYFAVLFALSWAARPLLRRILGPPQTGRMLFPGLMFCIELISLATAVMATLAMMRIERRPWREYGLPLRRAFCGDFWFGCLWGVLGLSLVMAVLRLAGAYYIDGLALHGGAIVRYALEWGAVFLLVGLFEEFAVRGYLLHTLASGIWFWPAAVLTSSLFLAGHVKNAGENWIGLADVFVIGMFFCFTLWRTGDLWFAVGLHAAWDWGQSYFYSVPDSGMISPGHLFQMHTQGPAWLSGGADGPEGSAVALVSHVLYFAVFAMIYKQRKWRKLSAVSIQPSAFSGQHSAVNNR